VDRCHYQLRESQIRSWLENYGVIQGDVVEEAVTHVSDNTTLGTGSYLVWLKLSKRLPNWVPMFGMKVKLSYKGGRAACKRCYLHHNSEIECDKRKWSEYVNKFKEENKDIVDYKTNRLDMNQESSDSNPGDDVEMIGERLEVVNGVTGNCNDDDGKAQVESGQDQFDKVNEEVVADRKLPDEMILSFFGENEQTESEMNWLKSHGELTEFEVLKLISKIVKNRASS
jgi:hypothetical protein